MSSWSVTFMLIMVFVASALASQRLCARLLPWLRAREVLDHPNERSLHAAPIPRGGGLAIVAVVLAAHAMLALGAGAAGRDELVVLVCGGGCALLGWADDRRSRGTAVRLLVQFALAGLCVAGLAAGPAGSGLGLLAGALLTVALVWHVNLFNFMDGADGLAGAQTVMSALGAAAVIALTGPHALLPWPLALAGAALGFLRWNWAPARLFLGDSGSYFIGFELAALVIVGGLHGTPPAPLLILLAPFVVDASLTLLARMRAGEPWWRAHRSHLYQRLVLGGWTARRLAVRLVVLNALLCWPLAWLALDARYVTGALLSAYALLGMMWAWLRRRTAAAAGPV